MSAETEVTMKKLRPFWGRVSVVESIVDDAERSSGLIVPVSFDESVSRGVVIDVDEIWAEDSAHAEAVAEISQGTVVFYQGGTKIGDVVILSLNEILAFEVDE